jgi:hypothetical protein
MAHAPALVFTRNGLAPIVLFHRAEARPMRVGQRARKKTAFVPRIIFQSAAVASVVPICVACSGESRGQSDPVIAATVACAFFDGGPCGVASSFDGAPDVELTVACAAFDGRTCGVVDGFDGGSDVIFTVAAAGFDASDGSQPDGEPGDAMKAPDASTDKG